MGQIAKYELKGPDRNCSLTNMQVFADITKCNRTAEPYRFQSRKTIFGHNST